MRNIPPMSTASHTAQQDVLEEERVLQFRDDVLKGLLSAPKRLSSKYFYDARGDALFQQIMHCQEYYVTRCELEIFREHAPGLINAITTISKQPFDLIELGVGDGIKSQYLLHELLAQKSEFTYIPVDISGNILTQLETRLADLEGLDMRCLEGEYFDMLAEATRMSTHRKVVLFLGANIGNMPIQEAEKFCDQLRNALQPGDIVLMGFDLKKNPHTILAAYNDMAGITRDFNRNLLARINKELDGNVDLNTFTHYQMYDPETGACKSYLVSSIKQTVTIAGVSISFCEGEWIFTEVSQKYSIQEIEKLAANSGFSIKDNFVDSKHWFVDTIWTAQ